MTAARIKTAELAGAMLDIVASETNTAKCSGLYYRYVKTSFVTKAGGVRTVEEIKPLKRRSCPGCDSCFGILDGLKEFPHDVEYAAGVCDGDVVRLSVVIDSTDWETGHADDWHVLATKVGDEVEAIEGGRGQ